MENVLLGLILSQLILLPLAYKWELDLKPVIIGGLVIGLVAGLAVGFPAAALAVGPIFKIFLCAVMIVVISAAILLVRFYRDPERTPPTGENIIVSPACGTVKYIKRVAPGNFPASTKGDEHSRLPQAFIDMLPGQKGHLIGIAMTLLDVHVTRAPIAGKLVYSEHVEGRFYSLKKPEALSKNERTNQIIGNGRYCIGLIHIASRLVRQIVTYVRDGERLALGQKIGMIRFGSQVDILLPELAGLRITVNVGDKVIAGTTVIATHIRFFSWGIKK